MSNNDVYSIHYLMGLGPDLIEKKSSIIDKVQKIILSVCRALEFSPAQANQALTERLVRELAPV